MKKLIFKIGYIKILFFILMVIISNILEIIGISFFIPIIESLAGSNTSFFTIKMNDILIDMGFPVNINVYLYILILFFIFKSLLIIAIKKFSVEAASTFQNNLRLNFFELVIRSSFNYIQRESSGFFVNILNEQCAKSTAAFYILLQQIIPATLSCLGYMFFAIYTSWEISLFIFSTALFIYPLVNYLNKRAQSYAKLQINSMTEFHSLSLETIQGKKIINSMNWDKYVEEKFNLINIKSSKHWVGSTYWSNISGVIIQPLSVIILAIIIMLAVNFHYPFSFLGVFLIAFIRLLPTFQGLVASLVDFRSNYPSYEKYSEASLLASKSIEDNGALCLKDAAVSIKFDQVSFGYQPGVNVIDGSSFFIESGAVVGIVGPSGSGKSTTLELILGLHKEYTGAIFINEINLRDLNKFAYRDLVGYVSQDIFLFHDSLLKNLTFGINRNVSYDELRSACVLAGIMEYVDSLPLGFDSIVTDMGSNLSGGQKQRISFVRAILRRPKLLILDEVTSALDSDSENIITNAIKSLPSIFSCTILIVSHRPKILESTSKILEIKKNHIFLRSNNFKLYH